MKDSGLDSWYDLLAQNSSVVFVELPAVNVSIIAVTRF